MVLTVVVVLAPAGGAVADEAGLRAESEGVSLTAVAGSLPRPLPAHGPPRADIAVLGVELPGVGVSARVTGGGAGCLSVSTPLVAVGLGWWPACGRPRPPVPVHRPPAPPVPPPPAPAPPPPPAVAPVRPAPAAVPAALRPAPAAAKPPPPPSAPPVVMAEAVPPARVRFAPHRLHRNYVKSAGKPPVRGTSLVTLTLVLTAPAVLAAALLRPRSGGGGGRRR
ncbi:hypothetical protein [Streptomyces griseocarneus]|uniref:hypothetical protein n=1 Tax=Streptomyces griseocarneus TaxID=51201 RepID=UPI00198C6F8C|nr:hypothetical protein [Streptomyces griseocarneus]MBZ6477124.1 hypothetical protein [Streptomyces griseocarneus]GHG53679.1 hypothetical protein GCM10018779_15830 [Streptomyces griseocarneus]